MANLSTEKKFLSPYQIRKRFDISSSDYLRYVQLGMPTYKCAGITRHPIDEVYLWCESHRIHLQDQNDMCTSNQIRKLLGITKNELENWEKAGLPKTMTRNKATGGVMYLYNRKEIIDWLRSHQNNTVEV